MFNAANTAVARVEEVLVVESTSLSLEFKSAATRRTLSSPASECNTYSLPSISTFTASATLFPTS